MIDSLKQAADGRVRQLWNDAETEAAKIRADATLGLEQLREEADRKKTAAAAESVNRAVSDAKSRARIARLLAEKRISSRLYETAKSLLPSLRSRSSQAQFNALAQELPPRSWQVVRVHAADLSLAKKCFPGADAVADAGISGGMEVSAQNGEIRVVNTFEKRLERAWGDMQPELIRDAYREVELEASSSESSGPGISHGVPVDEDQRETVAPDF